MAEYRPVRVYAEEKGWVYPDTSTYVRWYWRAKFFQGQQLWDNDLNNNFAWVGWWSGRWAHFRRNFLPNKRPPWYRPGGSLEVDIYDPKHDNNIPVGFENIIMWSVSIVAFPLGPRAGIKCFVLADRMMVAFNGTEWKPMFRLPQKNQNYEIAMFANTPKAGEILCTQKISQRFLLPGASSASRVRGISYLKPPLEILKNGVQVGIAFKSQYSSGARTMDGQDVIFEPGDILQLRASTGAGAMSPVAVSLVGGLA